MINYDVARDITTHTHRIGRTGRAGKTLFKVSFSALLYIDMLYYAMHSLHYIIYFIILYSNSFDLFYFIIFYFSLSYFILLYFFLFYLILFHFILFYYCTVFKSTVLYCIALHCIVLYCIVLCCIVLYCIALYSILLYCILLYCIVLYCIVLCCIVLYCIVLYCIVLCCIVTKFSHFENVGRKEVVFIFVDLLHLYFALKIKKFGMLKIPLSLFMGVGLNL